MLEDDFVDLLDQGWRQVFAAVQEVANLPEDPWPPLCRTPDHDGVGPGLFEHFTRSFRGVDVAIRRHGQSDRALDLANRVVFDRADESALARPAVHRQRGNARVFRDPGDPDRVALFAAPARADLQRDGHADCRHDRCKNFSDERLVAQERRARGDITPSSPGSPCSCR